MGIGETHCYWIYCDDDGCCETTEESPLTAPQTEGEAERRALTDGWTHDEDGWHCPDHTARKARKASGKRRK